MKYWSSKRRPPRAKTIKSPCGKRIWLFLTVSTSNLSAFRKEPLPDWQSFQEWCTKIQILAPNKEQQNLAHHLKVNFRPRWIRLIQEFRRLRNQKDAILRMERVWFKGRIRNRWLSTGYLNQHRASRKKTNQSTLTRRNTLRLIWWTRHPRHWIRIVFWKKFSPRIIFNHL